jgi:hypothetical protein
MWASLAGYLIVNFVVIILSAVARLSLVVKFDRDRKSRLNRIFCTLL